MKKINFLIAFALLGSTSFAQKAVAKLHPDNAKIVPSTKATPQVAQEIAKGDAYLVDVRAKDEFQKVHLKNALNIDVKQPDFLSKIGELKKGKKIYLYCRSGHRSGLATDSLQNLGYKNVYNIGGLDSLVSKGFTKN